MKISELTHEQQIALVGIIEAMAMSDGNIDEFEQKTIGQMATEFGDEAYRNLINEADEKYPTLEHLKLFLITITNQEARETIYGVAMQDAMLAPAINHLQSGMLEWLRDNWDITVEEA
jgi:uncharacterized membrane protein YebE (DUF533 family)